MYELWIPITLIILMIAYGGMIIMFGQKKTPTPTQTQPQEQTQKEIITISKNPFRKQPKVEEPPTIEPTAQEIIATNTDLWYKEQVLLMLTEIVETLREFKK